MSKADRIYKVLRSNLSAADVKKAAEAMQLHISDHQLTVMEQIIEEQKKFPSASLSKAATVPAEATVLAEKLRGYVLERYPHYESTINIPKWAKEISLLQRQDARFTYEIIEAVMKFMFEIYEPTSDRFDWREQIRSGGNFRKHFVSLLDQARKEQVNNVIPTAG